MFKVEVIKTTEEFQNLREEWNNLLSESKADTILLTWEWLFTWWEIFGVKKDLSILLIREGGKLIGIAPLMISKEYVSGMTVYFLKFIGSEDVCSEYLDFIIIIGKEPEILNLFFQYINQNTNRWDILLMNDITEDSLTVGFLSDKVKVILNRHDIIKRKSTINPYMHLSNSTDDFYQKLGSKRRSDIRVKIKRLSGEHKVSYSEILDKSYLTEYFGIFVNLHRTLWNERGLPGMFKKKIFLDFHKAVAFRFFEKDWLKLYFLNVDDIPVASLYGFKYKDKFYYYQSGFDPKWKAYGAGKLLIVHTVTEAIKTNLREYDFLRGDADYKYQFTNKSRNNLEILITKNDIKGKTYIFNRYFKKSFKNVLKNILPQAIVSRVKKIRDNITLK